MSRKEPSWGWRRHWLHITALRLNENRSVHVLARLGLVMKGIVYLTIGGIAQGIALGAGGHASQIGALGAIATTRRGTALLWVATGGLFGLALWQLTEAAWIAAPNLFLRFFRRLVPLIKAVGFAGTGLLTLVFAIGFRPGSAVSMTDLTEDLLTSAAGQLVVLAAGGILVGVGIAAVFRGLSRHFHQEITIGHLRPRLRRAVDVIGVVGYVSKGLAYVIAGGLLATALLTRRAAAFGLDGALSYLASLPSGTVLLSIVALGLAAHGCYLIIRCVLFPDAHRTITVPARRELTPSDPTQEEHPLELR